MGILDSRCTAKAIGRARPDTAVFAIGATEQHSSHLPLGTDWLIAEEISRRVAEDLGAYQAPPLPFSMSQCHGFMAGTVWLKPKTLAAVLADVVASLEAQGIRKIVLINCHGGNFVLEPAIRELNLGHAGLRLIMPGGDALALGRPQIFETAGLEVHAGESETSLELAFNAAHVKEERYDFVPPVGREFLDYAFMGALSERGVWGCPTLATVEKGRASLEAQVESICRGARATFELLDEAAPRGAAASGAGASGAAASARAGREGA